MLTSLLLLIFFLATGGGGGLANAQPPLNVTAIGPMNVMYCSRNNVTSAPTTRYFSNVYTYKLTPTCAAPEYANVLPSVEKTGQFFIFTVQTTGYYYVWLTKVAMNLTLEIRTGTCTSTPGGTDALVGCTHAYKGTSRMGFTTGLRFVQGNKYAFIASPQPDGPAMLSGDNEATFGYCGTASNSCKNGGHDDDGGNGGDPDDGGGGWTKPSAAPRVAAPVAVAAAAVVIAPLLIL